MRKISEKMGQSPCGLLTWVFSLTQTMLQQIASPKKVTLYFKSEKKKIYKGTSIEFVKRYWKKRKEHQRGKNVEGKKDIHPSPITYQKSCFTNLWVNSMRNQWKYALSEIKIQRKHTQVNIRMLAEEFRN